MENRVIKKLFTNYKHLNEFIELRLKFYLYLKIIQDKLRVNTNKMNCYKELARGEYYLINAPLIYYII